MIRDLGKISSARPGPDISNTRSEPQINIRFPRPSFLKIEKVPTEFRGHKIAFMESFSCPKF